MNRKALIVMNFIFGLVLISACSKNLMPPNAAQLGGAIADSEMGAIGSGNDSSGAGRHGTLVGVAKIVPVQPLVSEDESPTPKPCSQIHFLLHLLCLKLRLLLFN